MEKSQLLGSRRNVRTPALFLDRDGVLIEDVHYLSDPEKVQVLPGVDSLLLCAMKQGWAVVIITNQSGISRGFFDWDTYGAVTHRMLGMLEGRSAIDAIYANGYGPEDGHQPWRKPNPGMIVEAASRLNIDLSQSVLVGDRLSDLKAGLNARLCTLVHVRTGHGDREREQVLQFSRDSLLSTKNHQPAVHMIDDLTSFPLSVLSIFSTHP